MVKRQIYGIPRGIKIDIGKQFENLEKSMHAVKHVAQSALSLAEQNQNDITEIRTELRNTKSELTEVLIELKKSKNEMNYCKVNCDELKFECKTLKQHSNKLDNYSRRKNLVIRGIGEEKNESSVVCEQKVREFIKNKLKLHNDTVDAMKFAGCHRISGYAKKDSMQTTRNVLLSFGSAIIWISSQYGALNRNLLILKYLSVKLFSGHRIQPQQVVYDLPKS